MRLAFAPYILDFKKPAGTSRGIMTEKPTVFMKIYDEHRPDVYGIGEAAVFPNLSPEANEDLPFIFLRLAANIAIGAPTDLSRYSSVQFGLEQAILDYSNGGRGIYFPSPFTAGEASIDINGLIWMGSYDEMMSQVEMKLKQDFHCIKLKIGAIDWSKEIDILASIRERYSAHQLTLRVDANGAFSPDDAAERLKELAQFDIHSIEQPIAKGQWEEMAELCKANIIPIALDEELIGISDTKEKEKMLERINPQYIILKPALCGGFSGAEEWIALAGKRGIGWWVTSALESNIGLTALAQWTGRNGVMGPQGLGTGALYTNNAPTRLKLQNERLSFRPDIPYDTQFIESLDWRY